VKANLKTTASTGRKTIVPLGEVVDFNPCFGKDELADDSLSSFIPMKCVEEESGRFEPLGDRKVAEVRKGYTPFHDGDVIFAKVTPCMENGKAAVLKGLTNGVGFGSTEFFALRPKNGLEANYLFHFILQSNFRRDAARNMTGAVGLRRVPKQWLEQQTIPLPEPDEQRRIVAEIEKQFTRLEAGVAALRRGQANLKRYRAAVLKAACEGRLVPTEAELAKTGNQKAKFETGEALLARILTERRQDWQGRGQYKEPAAPDTENLPPLPEGWTWATLEQLCPLFADSAHRTPKYGDVGFPALGPRDVVGGRMNLAKARLVNESEFAIQTARHVPQPGDIVYSRELSLGWGAVVPDGQQLCMSQGMCLFRPHDAVNLRYFQALLNGPVGRKHAENVAIGSAHPHINLGDIKAYAFPLPPLAEQTRIVAEVERRLSVVEELESVVTANLLCASRLRQSILQKAFAGKLASQK
jgi:type I restriction enzyme, S subunit